MIAPRCGNSAERHANKIATLTAMFLAAARMSAARTDKPAGMLRSVIVAVRIGALSDVVIAIETAG
ncbi:MAG: hypothetical protein Pars92KO_30400 [Parasphingorhabdus sp.]